MNKLDKIIDTFGEYSREICEIMVALIVLAIVVIVWAMAIGLVWNVYLQIVGVL